MGLILVTGGANSGKSLFAEEKAREIYKEWLNFYESVSYGMIDIQSKKIIYVATSIVTDDEMLEKVKIHRSRRSNKWETIEKYKDFINFRQSLVSQGIKIDRNNKLPVVLLDCLTNMVTNIMFDEEYDFDNLDKEKKSILFEKIEKEIEYFIDESLALFKNVVIVTNELGLGIVPSTPLGRLFREIAGKINQKVAKKADEVYFVISGIEVKVK